MSLRLLKTLARHPGLSARLLARVPAAIRGAAAAREWLPGPRAAVRAPEEASPLKALLERGGITKWSHYAEPYHRHLARFVGRPTRLLEIGIHHGASLALWRDYLGPECGLVAVDIDPACARFADARTEVFIGDQGDRAFWRLVKSQSTPVDVVIDDGGHEPSQQIATFEELMPHLRPGGVYLCEDVHGSINAFAAYVHGLAHGLNDFLWRSASASDAALSWAKTPFQAEIGSIHLYPYMTVVEKTGAGGAFVAPQGGA